MILVDELRDYGSRGQWCHLWSDTSLDELHAFAESIGCNRKWIHVSRGISGEFPHYDLRPSMRKRAIRAGAVEMPLKEWIRLRIQS